MKRPYQQCPPSTLARAMQLRARGYGPWLIERHLADEGIVCSRMVISKWIYNGVRARA